MFMCWLRKVERYMYFGGEVIGCQAYRIFGKVMLVKLRPKYRGIYM